MKTNQQDSELLTAEVNRQYWESDTSVNQIGEELGLSKGALYGILCPLLAGLPCIECGEEMAYPNRTARDKGFVACSSCGYEDLEEAVQEHWQNAADLEAAGVPVDTPTALSKGSAAKEHPRAQPCCDHTFGPRTLAGTALLGVATGIVIGSLIRKR